MKIKPIFVSLLLCAFLVSGCDAGNSQVTITDKAEKNYESAESTQAILDLYTRWNDAVEAGDREGYLSILHNDIRMVPQAAEDIIGIKDYGEFLIPVFANASYQVTPLTGWDIEFLSEDTAQVRYDYIIDITMKGDVDTITDSEAALSQMSNNLKYNDVVKRDASGSWKVLRHMWNAGYERE